MNRFMLTLAAAGLVIGLAGTAHAGPIDVLVGDKDNYGGIPGCSDSGTCLFTGPPYDGRSAAEAAAANGAQFTDIYSALFPGFGPNTTQAGDVILAFTGTLTSASLTVAMGDFQCSTFGATLASINGTAVSFCFDDGFQVAATRSFVLTAAELAAANLAHQVVLHIDHNNNNDFIAFDWFELTGDATTVPEPSTLALLGVALLGIALSRRRPA